MEDSKLDQHRQDIDEVMDVVIDFLMDQLLMLRRLGALAHGEEKGQLQVLEGTILNAIGAFMLYHFGDKDIATAAFKAILDNKREVVA